MICGDPHATYFPCMGCVAGQGRVVLHVPHTWDKHRYCMLGEPVQQAVDLSLDQAPLLLDAGIPPILGVSSFCGCCLCCLPGACVSLGLVGGEDTPRHARRGGHTYRPSGSLSGHTNLNDRRDDICLGADPQLDCSVPSSSHTCKNKRATPIPVPIYHQSGLRRLLGRIWGALGLGRPFGGDVAATFRHWSSPATPCSPLVA